MYHTLCLSFVRFESMDVIRGNFRLVTEEQPSYKDGGGLEHSSGELDFMHQLRSLHPGIVIKKVPQRNKEVFGFQSQNLLPLNLFHKPVPRWPTCPWRRRGGSWRTFSRSSVRSRNASSSNRKRGRKATLALSPLP